MAVTSTKAESIDLVRQYTRDVFNGRDYSVIADLQADDYVQYGPLAGMELHGSDESEETLRMFHAGFSDLKSSEILTFSDDDGEYVCSVMSYRGTHDGDLMGIPPSDVEVEIHGIVVNRIEDGTLAEAWVSVDFAGVLQQIGVIPEVEELAA
jgi:predicted ester cyclase